MKFLVTCGGGFQGQTVLEDLESSRREEDYIFVANNSTNHLNHALCDETIISPNVSNVSEYTEFIKDSIHRLEIDLVIPATALDLEILSNLKCNDNVKKFLFRHGNILIFLTTR